MLSAPVDGLFLVVILRFIMIENNVVYNLTVNQNVIRRYVKVIRTLRLFSLHFCAHLGTHVKNVHLKFYGFHHSANFANKFLHFFINIPQSAAMVHSKDGALSKLLYNYQYCEDQPINAHHTKHRVIITDPENCNKMADVNQP